MDWSVLQGAVYATYSVGATLTVAGTSYELEAIDETAGVVDGSSIEVQTIRPGARVLAADLAALGVTTDRLDGGQITINGATWKIEAHRLEPTTNGTADGEVLLLLTAA